MGASKSKVCDKLKGEDRLMAMFNKKASWSLNTINEIWKDVLSRDQFELYEFEKNKDFVEWKYVSLYQKLTVPFITKYKNRIDFKSLSSNKYLSDEIICAFPQDLDMYTIWAWKKLSAEVLIVILPLIHSHIIGTLLTHYTLEESIHRFLINLSWIHGDKLSRFQRLSESFMIEFQKKLNWKLINRYQRLTLEFIETNPDLVIWEELSYNKHLTQDIVLKHRLKLKNTEEVENGYKKKL